MTRRSLRKCPGVRDRQPPTSRSSRADLDDLELERTPRNRHIDLVADFLAHEALADGAGEQDLVLVVVLVTWADQHEVLLLVEIEIEHPDLGAEDDAIRGHGRLLNDEGATELVLKVVDLGLEHPLGLHGRVELGILRKVAVTPGLGDLLGNPGHLLVFPPAVLGLHFLFPSLRIGYSPTVHPPPPPPPSKRPPRPPGANYPTTRH